MIIQLFRLLVTDLELEPRFPDSLFSSDDGKMMIIKIHYGI